MGSVAYLLEEAGAQVTPFVQDADFTLYCGDALEVLGELDTGSVDACVTSPPYLSARPEYPSPSLHEFEGIFRELGRVVNGPALVNVGRLWRDGIEQMWWVDLLRSAERAGWCLLDTLIWVKPNANPIHGAVLASSHEYVLVLGQPGDRLNVDAVRTAYADQSLSRLRRRFDSHNGVKGDTRDDVDGLRPTGPHEDGARGRSVFVAYTGQEQGNTHPAPMPLALAKYCVTLASWPSEIVLDPFAGSGTTNLAARTLGRRSIGIELSPEYAELCARRLQQQSLFAGDAA